MRAYDDEVAVRTRDDGRDGVEPDAFVWRGRLYAVHLVLDRWVQRRPWWRLAFETPAGAQVCAEGDVLSDVEEDVWRVEAAVGRARDVRLQAGYGVYELVCSGSDWRLAAVSD